MRKVFNLFSLIIFISIAVADAEVPKMMNYQGNLVDNQGLPVTDTLSMTFNICDAETDGNILWTEMHPAVPVVSGSFNVILGDGNPQVPIEDTIFTGGSRWLEVSIGRDVITPRTRLVSMPWALGGGNWELVDDVIYASGYGIAQTTDWLYGDNKRTHVNLGVLNTTGRSDENNSYCTVSGGYFNVAAETYSAVGGGYQNGALGAGAFVGGGAENVAGGLAAIIPGGWDCEAVGSYSFATGRRAKALHDGAFVWADDTNEDFTSTTDNQMSIRAENGVRIAVDAGGSKTTNVGERYRDNGIVAWGTIWGNSIADSYGVSSFTHNSAGNYTITITAAPTNEICAVATPEIDTQPTSAAAARIIAIDKINITTVNVYMTDGYYNAVDNDFHFVITAR